MGSGMIRVHLEEGGRPPDRLYGMRLLYAVTVNLQTPFPPRLGLQHPNTPKTQPRRCFRFSVISLM